MKIYPTTFDHFIGGRRPPKDGIPKTLASKEAWGLCSFFLVDRVDRPAYEAEFPPKGMTSEATRTALQATSQALQALPDFTTTAIEQALRPLAERLQLKTRDLFGAIRIAVTGRTAAPPLFDTLAVIGKERVLARLAHADTVLRGQS